MIGILRNGLKLGAALAALGLPGVSQAIDFTGVPYVTYGDGNSYSLPISQYLDGCTGPGCDFYVNSTPGAIKDLIVVATGSSGTGVTTNIDGIEGAYDMPSGKNGSNFIETETAPDPSFTGAITTFYAETWDAEVSALNAFSAGEDLIFYFNNNQVNSCDSGCQNLAVWAQVWITDATGAVYGDILEFTNQLPGLTPTPGEYDIISSGVSGGILNGDVTLFNSVATGLGYQPLAGDNDATDYVLSGGQICVTDNGIPLPCDTPEAVWRALGATELSGAINHNLGANEAAYAVVFPELEAYIDAIGTAAGYTLHVDFKMGCDPLSLDSTGTATGTDNVNEAICTGLPDDYGRNINNGYEQIFIGTASTTTNVPSPATILLLGLGLLGMGLIRRRQATV